MASNLVHSALATHTQVFPVLTATQINRIRPFASLRHAVLSEVCLRLTPAMSHFHLAVGSHGSSCIRSGI
jgi:hypothetical protein